MSVTDVLMLMADATSQAGTSCEDIERAMVSFLFWSDPLKSGVYHTASPLPCHIVCKCPARASARADGTAARGKSLVLQATSKCGTCGSWRYG